MIRGVRPGGLEGGHAASGHHFVHALNAARNYLEERGTIPVFAYALSDAQPDRLHRVALNPTPGRTVE
jgi:hypothetical protein